VALIVQKYGGSSVADAASIKRVAKRIAAAKRAGNEVVVVVSAMGDTTDELIELAKKITPLPPSREMDILLTAGERISMSLLAMAIANLGVDARSFTGQQAGVITDTVHGKARIIDVTPSRIRATLDAGEVAIVAGFQGVTQYTNDVTTLGRGGSDTTAVALAAIGSLPRFIVTNCSSQLGAAAARKANGVEIDAQPQPRARSQDLAPRPPVPACDRSVRRFRTACGGSSPHAVKE